MICATFVVAGLGVSRNPEAESLWGAASWLAVVLVGGAATRIVIRRWAPNSNEILLGLIGLLIGIGWVFVVRTDPGLAPEHTLAVLAGFVAIAGTLVAVAHLDRFIRRPGTWAFIAVFLAGLGSFASASNVSAGIYDAPRQWLQVGTLSVQPYGIAKIAVIVAACGFTATAPRWLSDRLIPHRHAAYAIAAAIGAWILLIVGRDLASSVVIFLAAWLPLWLDDGDYLDRELPTAIRLTRTRALTGVLGAYGIGVIVLATVYHQLSAQVRYWLNPWVELEGAAVVDAAFAISAGGISGVGPGLGAPQRLHAASSDFIFAVIAEELGLLGGAALIAGFMLLVGIGAGIAQRARGTHRLLAATATFVIGLQALAAIAGVLRILPHTVGALPFVAHGPLALIGSCVTGAMLLGVSDSSGGRSIGDGASPVPEQPELPMRGTVATDAPTGELRLSSKRPARRRRPSAGDPTQGKPQQLPLGDP